MATQTPTKTHADLKVNIGLTDKQRQGSIDALNTLLADLHVVYVKTRNYHWNVVGPHFFHLHEALEEQYDQLADAIDLIAERVRMFGGHALGSMAEFIAASRLKEQTGAAPGARAMLENLLADHEAVIRHLREDIDRVTEAGDATTADILTAQAEMHEKMAWMLRASLATDHSLVS